VVTRYKRIEVRRDRIGIQVHRDVIAISRKYTLLDVVELSVSLLYREDRFLWVTP
jgi:hypothetical protein